MLCFGQAQCCSVQAMLKVYELLLCGCGVRTAGMPGLTSITGPATFYSVLANTSGPASHIAAKHSISLTGLGNLRPVWLHSWDANG